MSKKTRLKKGQVVLFVIVVLTATIIIVSSIVERSLTGQRNTSINTDSSRAFNAAEVGIDELLSRTDLSSLASGTKIDTKSVDRNFFQEANYTIINSNPGYFGIVDQNSLLQVEFDPANTPNGLKILFDPSACAVVSLYSYVASAPTNLFVKRMFMCGNNVSGTAINGISSTYCAETTSSFSPSNCVDLSFNVSQIAKMLTVRVLKSNSNIEFLASNFNDSFLTKAITVDSMALTRSGVKKEIQVETKTTRDIYPVFDHVLYVR